jgi:hypothetical protein
MFDFAHPALRPSPVTYTSADDRYSVYGWTVAMHRTAREFSTLGQASCHGFALSGSGTATVLTPSCYRRGARYDVTLSGTRGSSSAVVRAHRDRRLALTVPLGPSNPYQEGTPQAELVGTTIYTTHVVIARVG